MPTVTTDLGPIDITVTDAGAVSLKADGLTINGVAYRLSATAHRHSDGVWRSYAEGGGYQSIYLRRADDLLKDPTDAARRRVYALIPELAAEYATPEAEAEAARVRALEHADRREKRARSLRELADQLDAEAALLRNGGRVENRRAHIGQDYRIARGDGSSTDWRRGNGYDGPER